MKVLALETSCDETSCAITQDGRKVLSNVIASQVETHRPYGGVVPEIAARKHIEALSFVVGEALALANATLSDIDAYAVTHGPGLIGALLVGLSYTKALAFAQQKPFIGVQHIEGHICANYLDNNWEPPFICLVVAGGHTMIAQIEDYQHYTVLGRTRDDASGEAFDKVARTLGLPYPGGPHIDALARTGNGQAIRFPRTVFSDGDLDFSFSGLKSAVIQYVSKAKKEGEPVLADVAASFQEAVVEVLTDNTLAACERVGLRKVALAGGVASNSALREAMRRKCQARGFELQMPLPLYCTDNAAMIACRGYLGLVHGMAHPLDLNAFPSGTI